MTAIDEMILYLENQRDSCHELGSRVKGDKILKAEYDAGLTSYVIAIMTAKKIKAKYETTPTDTEVQQEAAG